jgi:choline dehydrogenase-like flavoprotein
MRIGRLGSVEKGSVLKTDLAIVGGGPVGLTIAQLCAAAGISVLVLESGLEKQDEAHEALNALELEGHEDGSEWSALRRSFHGQLATLWSDERQPYGVRCRGLGGSSQAWAGKSAPFDPIDFARREWVENSGWPITLDELRPYIEQAGELLNLCPAEPTVRFAGEHLTSFYWQFARSRIDHFDVLRFGKSLLVKQPPGVDILLDATVTRIALELSGGSISHVEVADLAGGRRTVSARHFVLAASAIENARLLLASNDVAAAGIGNQHDLVGRFMMDHAGVQVGAFDTSDLSRPAKMFGFYGVPHRKRSHMFMHGLALAPRVQESERLLNAAVWFAPRRAPDDPWDSLKRLLKGRSKDKLHDMAAVARGTTTLAKGVGMHVMTSPRFPSALKDMIANAAIRLSPNFVAEEFQSGGLPHKLSGLSIEAVTEQAPCRENRLTLGGEHDRLGMPIARARWRVGEAERRTLLALARETQAELAAAGLPSPRMAEWVAQGQPDHATPIDLAHTMGTTRMAEDPKNGVVDPECRVHGIANLHVAGGSVFPTGGHANPTWMMLAVACRLAARLQREFR